MIYKGYTVKWEQKPRVVDPLFNGLEFKRDNWDYLQAVINRYLALDSEMKTKHEKSLRIYLISRDAHNAFRTRSQVGTYEIQPFEFWVLLRMYLEWNEASCLLSNLPLGYAHRYLTEVAPDLSYGQKKDDVKIISEIKGMDIPYEILLKLVASASE